jgi:hypothetical protein
VIVTMLLVGVFVGRAWAIPAGAVVWVGLLLLGGTIGGDDIPAAAALGGANVAAGALTRRLLTWPSRRRPVERRLNLDSRG